MKHVHAYFRRAGFRVRFAWFLGVVCVLLWPCAALTFARHEPPTVLGLSFLALIYTSVDIIFSAELHER